MELAVGGAQVAVKVHWGLVRHPVRADDLAVRADAKRGGPGGAGKVERGESVVLEEEAVRARGVVVGADDSRGVVDPGGDGSLCAGNLDGAEIEAALDCGEACEWRGECMGRTPQLGARPREQGARSDNDGQARGVRHASSPARVLLENQLPACI